MPLVAARLMPKTAMIEALPMIMPSIVSAERTRLRQSEAIASSRYARKRVTFRRAPARPTVPALRAVPSVSPSALVAARSLRPAASPETTSVCVSPALPTRDVTLVRGAAVDNVNVRLAAVLVDRIVGNDDRVRECRS